MILRYYLLAGYLISLVAAASAQPFKTKHVVNHWEMVVKATDTWQFWPGTSQPDSNWNQRSYNAAGWATGKGGFGYGDGDDSTVINSAATSVYVRRVFLLKDTSKIYDMLLALDYDDGFVAWLNGKEITRRNLGVKGYIPAYDSLATASREATMYQGGQPEYFVISKSLMNKAKLGDTNVLCIQVHNAAGSGDMSCIPYLFAGINDASTGNYFTNPTWFTPPLTTHLPLFVIDTYGQGIPDDPSVTAGMGVVDNGKDQNHLGDPYNGYLSKIKIQTRGSSSQGFPQRQYAMTTCDTAGNQQSVNLLGMPKQNDWILYASYTDKSMMRNTLAYYMSREMGWYASRTRFIEMIIDGQYVGVYELMEKLKIDDDRVDIPEVLPATTKGDSITGGYLMKVDRVKQSGPGVWWSPITTFNSQTKSYRIQTVEPDIPVIPQVQANYIHAWMDSFELNLNSASYTDPAKGYHVRIDANSFIDFYIVNEVSKNIDGYRLSSFIYKQRNSLGGRLYSGPVWDFNLGFGNANYCNGWDTTAWNTCGYDGIPFWYERLLMDNNYKKQFKCRWLEYRKGLLKTQNVMNWIDSVAEYLSLPAKRHFAKWQILGTYVWPNWYIGNTYQEEVNWLKKYVRGRMNWMDKNMPNVSTQCNSIAANNIKCTEINYNCHPNLNGGNWIELHNRSAAAVAVGNFVFGDNSPFRSYTIPAGRSIPAGGYLLIVEDTAAFRKTYPGVTNFVGPTNFGLANDGGTFTLYDQLNFQVLKITYNDKAGWPTLADGKGRTLELIDPMLNPNNPASWFAGCVGGSPGTAYLPCKQPVVISEINYSSHKNADAGDWVELHNADSFQTVNLKGLLLKDDNDSNIFTFAQINYLPPLGYLIVCADSGKFDNIYPSVKNRKGNLGFGLGAGGDAVRLMDSTGWVWQEVYYTDSTPFPYGAKGTGFTIEYKGNDNNSLPATNWALSCYLGSPGQPRPANCSPNGGKHITLTELHLWDDPKAQQGKWIELYNADSTPLNIAGWKLSRSGGNTVHTFGSNASLASKGFGVIADDSTAFARYHGLQPMATATLPLQLADSLFLTDTFGLIVAALAYDVSSLTLTRKLYRSAELIHPDSNTATSSNWVNGCVNATPAKAFQACVPVNFITEINYAGTGGQWLEMYNPTNAVANWSRASLFNGNDSLLHTFPAATAVQPNQRLLLVADSASFAARFPLHTGLLLLRNALATSGETLRIIDSSGRVLYSTLYETTHPFDTLANGHGYTLELLADTLEPTAGISWLHSCPNGTPGFERNIACKPAAAANLYFSELNPNPEGHYQQTPWTELHNSDTLAASLGGWGLFGKNGLLYRFGVNETIPAQDYTVYTADSASFSNYYGYPATEQWTGIFDQTGDSLWLTDYFGNTAATVSFATKPYFLPDYNQLGKTLETVLPNKTPWQPSDFGASTCYGGSPGAAAAVCSDSLIVSEINYHSSDTLDAGDWLELYNPLTVEQLLTTTELRIDNQIHTVSTASIPADSFLVIAADSVKFRSQFPAVPNVVFLPGFVLSDSGSRLFVYSGKRVVHSLHYNNTYEALASGGSYTLESDMSPQGHYQQSYWNTGCPGGSPGHRTYSPCDTQANRITNHLLTQLKVAPNPTQREVYLLGIPAGQAVYLYSVDGNLLAETRWVQSGQAVSLQTFAAGIYVLQCGQARFKVLKY